MTGMYNVLDKLRNGEPLNAAERSMNELGLVSVLQSLHDQLDAAVLQAYGWSDLSLPADTDALLLRLVELNTQRASEEATGLVRWLRPDFQRTAALGRSIGYRGNRRSGRRRQHGRSNPGRHRTETLAQRTGRPDQGRGRCAGQHQQQPQPRRLGRTLP